MPTTPHGWRSLFWFGAGPPILIIAFRLWLPETNHFQVMKAEREAKIRAQQQQQDGADGADGAADLQATGFRAFVKESGKALRANWVLFIYMVVLMTGFNSCSHGSQDFYPTFLKDQVGMDPTDTTVVTVVGQIGALLGGSAVGYTSSFFGRRLSMICSCILGGALIPAYVLPRNMSLVASAFVEQFFVGGAWGPIPIHLVELSPNVLRSLTVGLTYQLGNLASSASATIQSVIAERYPLPSAGNEARKFDYGRVIAIFMGAVWAYMLFFLLLGPEMSQEERQEEAEAALYLERLRLEGVSLAQIGEKRAVNSSGSSSSNNNSGDGEEEQAPESKNADDGKDEEDIAVEHVE